MPWIKAIDKYPDGFKLARKIGDHKSMPVRFAPHVIAGSDGKTYKREELEYFDVSEPSFNIEDMEKAFVDGYSIGLSKETVLFSKYMYHKYNIDITKQ